MKKKPLRITASLMISLCAVLPPRKAGAQEAELERIVVRKALASDTAKGVVTSVLTADEIKNIPADSPEDLLTYVGADLQSRGPYGVKSDVSLNGSTFQQVLILVNGIRVNDPQTAHHDLDLFFNLEDIERVEVIPASAASVYGPDGIGGAINFVLKKPVQEKSSLSLAGGNRATSEQKGRLNYSLGPVANSSSASHIQSKGFRYDTDFRTDTFFHSSRWETKGASVFVDAGYNDKVFGAYDFYTPGRGFPSKEWLTTKFFDVRGNMEKDGLRFEPRVSFRRHHDKFMLDITRPDYSLNHHTTDSFQAGGTVSYSPLEGLNLSLGADGGYDSIVSDNLGNHWRRHWDVYADPSWHLTPSSNLRLTLRVDDYSSFGAETTGGATWSYLFGNKTEWYVTAGRTMRVPTFTELYYSDPTTAGNSDLKPEKAYNLESGLSGAPTKTTKAKASVFVRRETDTIDFTKLSAADPKFIARNISRALSWGINLSGQWAVHAHLNLDARYTYTNKHSDDGGFIYKYGLNYLSHLFVLGIETPFRFGVKNRAEIVMKKEPDRRAWSEVNDRLSWSPKQDWEIFFEAENLLNGEYQDIEGIPEPGRITKLGVKYTW